MWKRWVIYMFFLSLVLFYVVVYQPIIAKIIWLILEHIYLSLLREFTQLH